MRRSCAAIDDAAAGRSLPELPPAPPTVAAAASRAPADPHPSGPVRVPPPRRSWARRSALVLVPLVALFVGAGVAALVLIGVLGGRQAPGPAAAVAADTRGGSGVTLAAADYVGRPVDEVATQLSGLGLTVQRQQDPTAAAPAGTVTRIDPAGVLLRPGDPVRVSYAVPLGTSPSSSRAPRTEVTVRAPADAVASTSAAAPTTAQQPVSAGTSQRTATATSTSTTTTTSTATSTSSSSTESDPPSSSSSTATSSPSTPSGGGTD